MGKIIFIRTIKEVGVKSLLENSYSFDKLNSICVLNIGGSRYFEFHQMHE